jgi:hypothetical protein
MEKWKNEKRESCPIIPEPLRAARAQKNSAVSGLVFAKEAARHTSPNNA